MHFFITGFMASGKTYWAQQMSLACNLPCIDLDEFIEQQIGQSIATFFEQHGEASFRALESTCLQTVSNLPSTHIISCGGGTSCSAENRALMKQTGSIIYIDEDIQQIIRRLQVGKQHRPLLAAVSDADLARYVEELILLRTACYENYDFCFRPNHMEATTFAHFILSHA